MSRLRMLASRIAGMVADKQAADASLREELAAHLEMEIAENVRRGIAPAEARRMALAASGGFTGAVESVRDQRGLPILESVAADVRFAARTLRRSPAYTLVSVATLAVGIGATTAIFSVVSGVLLQPLPYPNADRLMSLTSMFNGYPMAVSAPDFDDWRRTARSFSGVSAGFTTTTVLTGSGDATQLDQARVSANAFDVLGIHPVIGRAFVVGEDEIAAPRVAIISERMWRTRFGADSSIVGRAIILDGFPTTVVGVAPSAMRWPERVDVWLTTRFTEKDLSQASRGSRYLTVVARLNSRSTPSSANDDIKSLAKHSESVDPRHNKNVGARVDPLLSSMVDDVRAPLFVLLGAVGFVLLIACANVGSLALGRLGARESELAMRTALGASRSRIARQMLTESLIVALVGGLLGLVLANFATKALIAIAPSDLPRLSDVRIDVSVVAFGFLATLLTALLFGVAPALYGGTGDLRARLVSARGSIGRRSAARSRQALVVTEIALAIVLLAGAGLLLRTIAQLRGVDPGFRAKDVYTFSIGQLPHRYATHEQEIELTTAMLDRLRHVPGVSAADVSFSLPLDAGGPQFTFKIQGRPDGSGLSEPRAQARSAGITYFATMGIPLIRGRLFTDADRGGVPGSGVILISADLAKRYFPNEDPIGKTIETGWGGPGWPGQKFGGTIVGIVGDVRQRALDGGQLPHMYMPYAQWPIDEYSVVIRSSAGADRTFSAARSILRDLDRDIAMSDARSMTEIVDASMGRRHFYLVLLSAFAVVALLLATIGVYGVMAYGVEQRRQEIGVRLTLGSTRQRVLMMVLGDGLRLSIVGVAIGLVAAFGLTRLLSGLLYGVVPTDLTTFTIVPAILFAAAVFASLIPASRAAAVDPVEAIRS